MRPEQNGQHFAENTFKFIFLKEHLKFAPEDPNDNNSALVHVMAWCLTGGKPLPEPAEWMKS